MKKIMYRYSFELIISLFMLLCLFAVDGVWKFLWLVAVTVLWGIHFGINLHLYKHYDKDSTRSDNLISRPEPPSAISPAGASYLLREKVDVYMVYGTLLQLVNKRILSLQQKENDYQFILTNPKKPMTEIENYVIHWLFIEKKTDVCNMTTFKQTYQTEDGIKGLLEKLKVIESIVKKEVAHFFVDLTHIRTLWRKRLLTLTLIEIGVLFLFFDGMAFMFPIFLNILLLFNVQNLMKKTTEGKEEALNWTGYTLFLEKRMDVGKRNAHEIILWDYHMTYAVALGCAKKAIQELDWLDGGIAEVNNGTTFTA